MPRARDAEGDDEPAETQESASVGDHRTLSAADREPARSLSPATPSGTSSGKPFEVRSFEPIDLSPQDRAYAHAAPIVFVASREDLWHLTTDLRREDRDYAIVVLTLGNGGDDGFPPSAIRALDPSVPIYLLGNLHLCRRLTDTLGPQLAVEGGDARIFWPGVGEDSNAADHPLVPAHSANDRRDPAERLVSAFDLSRPLVRRYLAPIQRQLATFEAQATRSLVDLLESQAERDAALGRAHAAESRLAALKQQLGGAESGGPRYERA